MADTPEPLHRRQKPRWTPEQALREQEAREKLLAGLTPAQARAKRIELGMYVCPTECDDDCDAPCHESHEVLTKRMHPVDICEANVARGKPPIPESWYPTGCSCLACDGPYMPTFKEFAEGVRITKDTPRPPMDEANNRVRVRMSLCPVCGFKRCPGAADHEHRCTGSNQPGQPGSLYPAPESHVPTKEERAVLAERTRNFLKGGTRNPSRETEPLTEEPEEERRERYLANRDDPEEWG